MTHRARLARRPDGAPLVLGHRGFRARFPENTLLAFREAVAAGADGFECDVQKTADGRYVIIHDDTVDRVCAKHGVVASLGLAELQDFDVGRGERIPTLEKALEILPAGAWIDVELKSETLTPADCQPIARILDARVPRPNIMISSFEPRLLPPMKALGFTVALLLGEEALQLGPRRLAAQIIRVRPHWLNLPVDMFSRLGRRRAFFLLRLFRTLGFSILFWTVNDAAGATDVLPLSGIIVTDEVETMVGLREEVRRRR
jgi:glycerophosphoryl diester phosphodiesterase